jgi:hypothetical protein
MNESNQPARRPIRMSVGTERRRPSGLTFSLIVLPDLTLENLPYEGERLTISIYIHLYPLKSFAECVSEWELECLRVH